MLEHRIPEIVLGALLTILVFAMGFLAASQYLPQAPQIPAKQEPAKAVDQQGNTNASPSGKEGEHPQAGGGRAGGTCFRAHDIPIRVGEGVLGLATVVLAIVTWMLVLDARHNARIQLRAYVGLEKISFELTNENNPSFVLDLTTQGVIHDDFVAVKIRNFGNTPAFDVSVFAYFAIAPLHTRLADDFFARHDRDPRPTGNIRVSVSRFVLNPKQMEISKPIVNPHPVRDARARLNTLYVFGRVYYRDIYDRPWRTKFCYVWEPATPARGERFIPYEEYNGEDQVELLG